MPYKLEGYCALTYRTIQDGTEDAFWGGHMFQEYFPSALFMKLIAEKSMSAEFEKMLLQIFVCSEQRRIPNERDIKAGATFAERDAMLQAAGNVLFQDTKSYDKMTGGENGLLWNNLEDTDKQ